MASLEAVQQMEPLTEARVLMPAPPTRPGMIFREQRAAQIRKQHKRGEFAAGKTDEERPRQTHREGASANLDAGRKWESESADARDALVANRGVYRIPVTEKEDQWIVELAATFGMDKSEWVAGLGRGSLEVPFHRMEILRDTGLRKASIKISVWDDEYDDIITRLRMAQPLLASGNPPVSWYDYFRMAALGLLSVPFVRGEHRDRLFLPEELPLLRTVHSLVLAAKSTWPKPKVFPRFEEARRRFEDELWREGWKGTDEERQRFQTMVKRMWDWKREGPVSDATWAHCLGALEKLGRKL